MTEDEMFAYAMLAWCFLMVGTLLTVAWHLVNPAQAMSAGTAETLQAAQRDSPPARSEGCAQTPPGDPK